MLSIKRPHYAWMICFSGALALFVALGLGVNVFSFYMPDIIIEKGFTNAQSSLLPTVRSLFSLVSMLVVNPLCRRFGARKLIWAGSTLVAVCYLGFSLFDSFFAYCCCTALMGLGYTFSGSIPVAFIFVKWFETRRSLAMGIAAATSGLALLVAPPLLTRLLAQFGLNTTFVFHGGLCLLLAMVSFLLMRNTPEELSKTPYRGEEAQKKRAARRQPMQPPHTTSRHNAVILLVAVLVGGPIGAGYIHVSILLRTEGYNEMLVASAISFMGLILMVSKILCADIYDRIGGWRGNFFVCGMATAGLFLLILSPMGSVPVLFLGITLYSLGLCCGSISTYQWAADLYGSDGYADGVRSFNMAYTLGSLAFGPVPGLIADRFGSYVPAFVVFLVIFIIAAVMLQTLYHRLGLHKY